MAMQKIETEDKVTYAIGRDPVGEHTIEVTVYKTGNFSINGYFFNMHDQSVKKDPHMFAQIIKEIFMIGEERAKKDLRTFLGVK